MPTNLAKTPWVVSTGIGSGLQITGILKNAINGKNKLKNLLFITTHMCTYRIYSSESVGQLKLLYIFSTGRVWCTTQWQEMCVINAPKGNQNVIYPSKAS